MRTAWIGMGPQTIAFEAELARFVGAEHVVTVNSCTSALFLSLLVNGVGAGDEVICPSLTWCATANAALYLGAKPVFCDIDEATLALTPESVARCLSPRTRAVVAVHFGGLACDIGRLRASLPSKVAIVEDAAHAFDASYPDGTRVGSSGNLTCFSFYANKNLSTGEGGAIALHDGAVADRLRSLRQNALPVNAWQRYTHAQGLLLSAALTELGYKMNYTDLQAAIGRVQLARQEEFRAARLEVARYYVDALGGLPGTPLRFQQGCLDPAHARHLFAVQIEPGRGLPGRDTFILELRKRNIGATIHYAPLHTMPLYTEGQPPARLPATEKVAAMIVTLPISASMSTADADSVVQEVRRLMV